MACSCLWLLCAHQAVQFVKASELGAFGDHEPVAMHGDRVVAAGIGPAPYGQPAGLVETTLGHAVYCICHCAEHHVDRVAEPLRHPGYRWDFDVQALALVLRDPPVRAESSSHEDTLDREQVVKLAHFRALLSWLGSYASWFAQGLPVHLRRPTGVRRRLDP